MYKSKLLRILATFAVMAFCLQLQAKEYGKVTLKVDNRPLKEFLQDVEKQSGYTFFYTNDVLKKALPVTVDVKDKSAGEVLDIALKGSELSYEIIGDKIAIKLVKENTSSALKQISGVVIDENGNPMVGAAVLVAGSLNGVVTDLDGKYTIKALPTDNLQFSSLGYTTVTISASSRQVAKVQLSSDQVALEGVVVTALGIKRDEKSLGYSAVKVDGEQFSNSITSDNWVSGLTGQVAGLNIDRSNSGPNGSMRVTIRGESTVDLENNTALFVVDGVPMYNTKTTSDAGGDGSAYAIDYGDGTADIDPDNIANVTVLKGAAATALYGSQAANGAIIITTKSAEGDDPSLHISYKGSFAMDKVLSSPQLQYEYGQGYDSKPYYYYTASGVDEDVSGLNPDPSKSSTSGIESWGPKMDGTNYYQYYDVNRGIGGHVDALGNFVRDETPFISYGDWFQNYFQTGLKMTNNLTVNGRLGKASDIRVSLSDTRSRGIVPNTPSQGNFFAVRFSSKLAKWLNTSVSLNYKRNKNDNIPTSSGYGSTSIMYSLWCYAPNIDMVWPQRYWKEGVAYQQDASLTGGKNNAYFLAYECINNQNRDRVYGNLKFDFKLYKDLTLMIRGGLDMTVDFRTQRQATSTQARPDGYYREQNINSKQYSGDFLLKYNHRWKDIELTASLGGSMFYREYGRHAQTASTLNVPGVYSLANSAYELKVENYSEKRATNSLYGMATLSWKNAIFLDVTGRNDWSSTLPPENRSYFYPSVSGAVVLNDLFDFGRTGGLVNLMKIRASWAQVGHDTAPYRYVNYLQTTGFPGTVANPTSLSNSNLKPEIVSSWEVGFELRMFKNRLSFDAAYYDAVTKDLISQMPVSYATGVSAIYTNAGSIRNRGVELSIEGTLIKTRDFQWKLAANWFTNKNTVLKLGEGVDSWIVASYSTHAYMTAYEGGSLTSMYGKGFKRAPEGSTAIDANGNMVDVSGMMVLDKQGNPQVSEGLKYLGDCAPEWKGGFSTTFKWRGLTAFISFDGQYGGHVYSYTNWVLNYRGKGVNTLAGREGGMVPVGVMENLDGTYTINTTAVSKENIATYYHCYYDNTNAEANFVSTQFIKLREVRLEYTLPKKLFAKTKAISGASFAIYGNNLYCWSEFPGWDPEGVTMRGSSVVPGFEMLQMPSTAQFGATVNLVFL